VPPVRAGRQHLAAYPGLGDLCIQLGEQLIQLGRVLAPERGGIADQLGISALFDPPQLLVIGRVGLEDRFGLEVPAFPALRHPQVLGPVRARRADRRQRVPARDQHRFGLARGQVGAAQLDRPDAPAMTDGQVLNHVAGQRH
jgi:hypothetical protein